MWISNRFEIVSPLSQSLNQMKAQEGRQIQIQREKYPILILYGIWWLIKFAFPKKFRLNKYWNISHHFRWHFVKHFPFVQVCICMDSIDSVLSVAQIFNVQCHTFTKFKWFIYIVQQTTQIQSCFSCLLSPFPIIYHLLLLLHLLLVPDLQIPVHDTKDK